MQTWVTLAAKHATLASGIGFGAMPAMGWQSLDGVAVGVLLAGAGFAAVNTSRQARSCPLPPAAAARLARAEPSPPQPGTLTRIRRRVDGLLTGMLSDDAEHLPAQPPFLVPVPSAAEPLRSGPGAAALPWSGDYVDAITGPAARGRAASELPERVGSWPYLTVVRDAEDDQDAPPRGAGPDRPDDDSAFWGPELTQHYQGGSRRSKHRADDQVRPAGDRSSGRAAGSGSGAVRVLRGWARPATAGRAAAGPARVPRGWARPATAGRAAAGPAGVPRGRARPATAGRAAAAATMRPAATRTRAPLPGRATVSAPGGTPRRRPGSARRSAAGWPARGSRASQPRTRAEDPCPVRRIPGKRRTGHVHACGGQSPGLNPRPARPSLALSAARTGRTVLRTAVGRFDR